MKKLHDVAPGETPDGSPVTVIPSLDELCDSAEALQAQIVAAVKKIRYTRGVLDEFIDLRSAASNGESLVYVRLNESGAHCGTHLDSDDYSAEVAAFLDALCDAKTQELSALRSALDALLGGAG